MIDLYLPVMILIIACIFMYFKSNVGLYSILAGLGFMYYVTVVDNAYLRFMFIALAIWHVIQPFIRGNVVSK